MTDRILTTDTALHDLWGAVNAKRRAGTSTVKVDADALAALLKDHHTLYTALRERGRLTIVRREDQEGL